MQNKGLVKLFALLFGLVSIYQLSFSFKANQIEGNAKQFAIEKIADTEIDYDAKRALVQGTYLDSLKNEEVYNIGIAQYNFDEVKEKCYIKGFITDRTIVSTDETKVKKVKKTQVLTHFKDHMRDKFITSSFATYSPESGNVSIEGKTLIIDCNED